MKNNPLRTTIPTSANKVRRATRSDAMDSAPILHQFPLRTLTGRTRLYADLIAEEGRYLLLRRHITIDEPPPAKKTGYQPKDKRQTEPETGFFYAVVAEDLVCNRYVRTEGVLDTWAPRTDTGLFLAAKWVGATEAAIAWRDLSGKPFSAKVARASTDQQTTQDDPVFFDEHPQEKAKKKLAGTTILLLNNTDPDIPEVSGNLQQVVYPEITS